METLNKGGIFMAYSKNKHGVGYIIDGTNVSNVTFHEYVADSFEELPTDGVNVGDRAMFPDGDKIGIAMYFTTGWLKG